MGLPLDSFQGLYGFLTHGVSRDTDLKSPTFGGINVRYSMRRVGRQLSDFSDNWRPRVLTSNLSVT